MYRPPHRAPHPAARLFLAALAVLGIGVCGTAACGTGTTAEEWAGSVCSALSPWRTEITELNGRAQQEIAAAQTPEQTRAGLLDLLSGAQSATETAREEVVAAGTPDVAGGSEVAATFVRSLEGARDAYARAAADLRALPVDDEVVFYDGVVGVLERLTQEYAAAGVDTSNLDSVELREAFDEVEQCQ